MSNGGAVRLRTTLHLGIYAKFLSAGQRQEALGAAADRLLILNRAFRDGVSVDGIPVEHTDVDMQAELLRKLVHGAGLDDCDADSGGANASDVVVTELPDCARR